VVAEVAAQHLKHTCKMDQGRMCSYMTMHATNQILCTVRRRMVSVATCSELHTSVSHH
jgi:hypothetical protein